MTGAEIERAYADGQKAWEDGQDAPPFPLEDEASYTSLFWVGFMSARARDWFKRREMALYPDTVEPRP